MAAELPTYIKLEYIPDGQAKSAFLNDLDGTFRSAEQKFSEFTSEARRQVETALSVPRNNFGSLDLGVDQLRAAAAAQEARALAAREVAQATALAAQEEGDYGQKARLTVAAVQALAKEEEDAAAKARIHADAVEQVQMRLDRQKSSTDLLLQSTRAGATAQQSIVNSARSSRVAFVQLGQQLQDVTVQAQMGTNAFTIFSQQVPQAAFALSGLANSANATQARIGQLATFMAGPWGAAIFAATAVVGPLVYSLAQTGDEAEEASRGIEDLNQQFHFAAMAADELRQVNELLNEANREVERTSIAAANATRLKAERDRDAAKAALERARAEYERIAAFSKDPTFAEGNLAYAGQLKDLDAKINQLDESIAGFDERARSSRFNADILTAGLDEEGRKVEDLRTSINTLRQLYSQSGDDRFLQQALAQQTQLNELEGSSGGRDGGGRRTARLSDEEKAYRSATEEAGRYLKRLQDEAATIGLTRAELNAYEDAQAAAAAETAAALAPGQAAAQVLRDQADAIRDMSEQLREGTLAQAMRDLREEAGQRMQIEVLLTAGLEAEAAALQEIWRLESSLGPLTAERKAEILEIVRAEEAVTDEQRERQDLVADYLDATREVRSELEAIFSGRGFSADSFGEIFSDLQGRVLVKEIFGDSLKQLDDLVKGRSGVETNIDFLAAETSRAGTAIGNFADVMAGETARIASPSAATAPTQSAFDRAFADYVPGGASNDNWDELAVQGKAVADAVKVGTLALSPADYADLLGKAIADPLLAKLDETFGAEFFAQFSGILASAISGYVTGGEAGGIIGLFEGLNSKFGLEVLGEDLAKDFSEALGFGGQGAATGTLVNAIFGGSKSGSQIGGAIGGIAGSYIPIVGPIVGSIVGSLIGSLFGGGAKYGNFSSISGITGNNDQAKSAAGQLGNALEDAISKIADALDAEVGSYATSIGVTDGKYRISTTGRTGELKSGYSDVQVFGEGEAAAQAALQAAIADAIRDGAIQGLSPAALRLIQAADNIDAAIQDVIDFQSVFTRLQERQDPLGAALGRLDDEFEHLADVFAKAGASAEEWAQLDQLYQLERTETIKREIEALTSSLRPLYQSLTVGNSALPLRERQGLAELEYDSLASRVAAGDTSAYDDFADAARTLLEIERELYGSQQGYFDRLSEVTALTKAALNYSEAQTQAAIANSDDPTSPGFIPANDNQGVVDAIALSNSQLAAVNANIGTTNALLRQLASATGTRAVDYF